jgi:hypothetical protein
VLSERILKAQKTINKETILSSINSRSRDSSVGIATAYGLDDIDVGVRVPAGARIFLLHVVQTGSFYPMGTGGSFPPRHKAAGA